VAYTSASLSLNYPTPPWGWWTGMKTSSKTGFNFALFAEWLNTPFFSFVTDIEYTQRGAQIVYPVPGGWWSTDGRLDYISVPLLAKFRVPVGIIDPFLVAGPRADFLVDHQGGQIYPSRIIFDDFKRATLGASVGLGVQTASTAPVTISVELRYDFDFLNSYKNSDLTIHNNALDIWIGVGL